MSVALPVAIVGAGGFGREVAWLAESCDRQVACFVDDHPRVSVINEIRVVTFEELVSSGREVELVIAVGSPAARQALVTRAGAAGIGFTTLIHPRTERSRWVTWGAGLVVCAGSILTTNITLGAHVQINLDCTIGHDVRLGDFVTLAPGVHVSGWVFVGPRAYVGTGAVVVNGTAEAPLEIGADSVVGAGACVTRSVPAGATVVGVPAKSRS